MVNLPIKSIASNDPVMWTISFEQSDPLKPFIVPLNPIAKETAHKDNCLTRLSGNQRTHIAIANLRWITFQTERLPS